MVQRSNKFIFVVIFLFFSVATFAVPAFPGLIEFQQPNNGDKLNIYLKGDEKVHWAESEDGYTLLYDSLGYLCYAYRDAFGGIMPSQYRATAPESRSAQVLSFLSNTPRHLRFSRAQIDSYLAIWKDLSHANVPSPKEAPMVGERRALVILFQTEDCPFTHSKRYINMLFNQEGYNEYGAHGSVRDFYHQASNNQFHLTVDVIGPITGDREMGYYGGTNEGQYVFASEVVSKAEGMADFSRYDNDGDGVVDGVHILFAGNGEEAGAGSDRIWSHQWYVWDSPSYNGVTFGPYSCSPECRGGAGTQLTYIGVICHELGHVFGAPDYYDTDYGESGGEYGGLGSYDIMSSGSWNDNGRTPARHGAYTIANIYHWTSAVELSDPAQVAVNPSIGTLQVYRINTSTSGDYFLLENRQKQGFDMHIPGHGLLVYHVHPNASGGNVSNARHPQQLYILPTYADTVCPGSSPSSYGNIGSDSPFPGSRHIDSLTDNSKPWFRPWSGVPNNTPLRNIQEAADSVIYFTFRDADIAPVSLKAHYTAEHTVSVEWQGYGNLDVAILYSSAVNPSFSDPDAIYTTGDTLSSGNIVLYDGHSKSHTILPRNPNAVPDVLHFRLYLRLNDSTYCPTSLSAIALPYEYDTLAISSAQLSDAPSFSLFPNPANGEVTVRLDGTEPNNATVSVYDIMGRRLVSRKLADSTTISTATLPRGTYFVRLTSPQGSVTRKLEIIH